MVKSLDMSTPPDANANTEFNFSISTLYRINYWLTLTNEAAYLEDPVQYRLCLMRILQEIKPLLNNKDDRIKLHNEYRAKIEEALHDYLSKKKLRKQMLNGQKIKLPRAIFDILFDWESDLRSDADKCGLYMRRMDDATNALMN